MKDPPFAPQELDDRQCQRIRPARRAGGEDAVRPVVRRRCAHPGLRESPGAIEHPEHIEVREPLDVQEPRLILWEDFDRPLLAVLRPQSLGDLAGGGKGGVNGADGVEGEGGGGCHGWGEYRVFCLPPAYTPPTIEHTMTQAEYEHSKQRLEE